MKIKYVVFNEHSRRDRNGNTYWVSCVIRTRDGVTTGWFVSDSDSNVELAVKNLAGGFDYYLSKTYQSSVSVREFMSLRNSLPYAESSSRRLEEFIKKKLREKTRSQNRREK